MYQLLFIGFEQGNLPDAADEMAKNQNMIVKVLTVSEYLHYVRTYLFSDMPEDFFLIINCSDPEQKFSDYFKLVSMLSDKANIVAVIPEYTGNNIRRAFLAGFQDVLKINFSVEDISETIQNLLGGHNSAAESDIIRKTYQRDNRQTLDEKMLQLLVSETGDGQTLQRNRLLDLRKMQQYKLFGIALFKIDLPADDYIYNDYLALNDQLLTILSQSLDDRMSYKSCLIDFISTKIGQNLCVLFFSKTEKESDFSLELQTKFLPDVSLDFYHHTDYCVRISLSSFFYHIGEAELFYRQAVEASYYDFYEPVDKFYKRKITVYGQSINEFQADDFTKLTEKIFHNDRQYSITSFGEIFKNLSEAFSSKNINPKYAVKYVSTMFNKMIFDTIFVDYHTKMMMYFRHDIDMVLSMISSFDKIGVYLSLMIDELLYSSSREQEGANKAISDVKQYISKYYNKQITLKDASEYVHINPNYLSELFKKQTDTGFFDYLTQVRMENAKLLLLNTNKKIYQIGKEVGYEEAASFNRMFKKYAKISPKQFRLNN